MARAEKPLAVVTGASSGISYELAKQCARNGFDLIIAADEPEIETAAQDLRATGAMVEAVQADLSTLDGVDRHPLISPLPAIAAIEPGLSRPGL